MTVEMGATTRRTVAVVRSTGRRRRLTRLLGLVLLGMGLLGVDDRVLRRIGTRAPRRGPRGKVAHGYDADGSRARMPPTRQPSGIGTPSHRAAAAAVSAATTTGSRPTAAASAAPTDPMYAGSFSLPRYGTGAR